MTKPTPPEQFARCLLAGANDDATSFNAALIRARDAEVRAEAIEECARIAETTSWIASPFHDPREPITRAIRALAVSK